ncbi:MAG: ABC transporter substrate-binding protein [Chloroflexota bacterium]
MMNQAIFYTRLLYILIGCLAFTGCGRGEPPTPTPEPVTLSLITIDDEFAAEGEVIDQFQTDHPHIQISRQGYNQFPQQYLVASEPPDIMAIGPSSILFSAGRQGLLTDLTDLWAQSGLYESYPDSFRAMSEADGKQFFLPMAYSWAGFYYNPKIFDQYGLVPPETWDEFMLLADTLKSNGVTPLALAGESPFSSAIWFDYLNLRLNGPTFHGHLIRGQESYLDARVRTVFETWTLLILNEYFHRGMTNMSDFDALSTIIEGPNGPISSRPAGMVLADPLALVNIPESLRNQVGFFPFPIMDSTLPVGESILVLGYMVPSGALHVEEAIEFLSYMGQAEIQDQLYRPSEENLVYAPVRATDPSQYSEEIQRRMSVVLDADQIEMPYFLGNPPTMQVVLTTALPQFLREAENGTVNIDEILDQLETGRESALAQGEFVE